MQKLLNVVREHKFLFLILILASVLRFAYIGVNPPSLNWDEVSHGYNAYSILKTGKDEWGVTLPTIFRAYGDYKLSLYIYVTAISEFFFGLTPFAVRLPSVLAGIGTVFFTYLLVLELFRSKHLSFIIYHLALLSALLVAVEPWSLFLSRGAFEANLALFFIVAGVYFFLKGLQTSNFLLLSSFFLGLSVWSYNSARVFVPMLLISLFFVYRKELFLILKRNIKLTAYYLLLTTFFFLPMLYQLLNPVGQARYEKVSIINEGSINQIIESRQKSNLPDFIDRLFYNRPTYFVKTFLSNYISHFSPNFLFFKGGSHFQFSIPGHGLLYLISLPFLLIGAFWLLRERSRAEMVLLAWLFLGPVASSLTNEAPHVLRSITMLPIPMVVSAVGVIKVFEKFGDFRGGTLFVFYLLVVVFQAEAYLTTYFTTYRQEYSWSWQYGYKEAVDYAKENYNSYDKIIVSKKYGEPHEFFLFFWEWDPAKYQSDPNLIRFNQSNWWWVDRFDKFYFVNGWELYETGEEKFQIPLESGGVVDCTPPTKCLLVASPINHLEGWEKTKTINFLDGYKAFEIYEN